MATQSPRTRRSLAVRPRVKVWLEVNGSHVFCAGMCRILEAIDETGSIKDAAAKIGLSYRHVWARVREVEGGLGRPLVDSHVGGRGTRRTTLTPTGVALLGIYRDVRERLRAVSDECARRVECELATTTRPDRVRVS
jgi:molybdate transport system regulatory protein